ncbi:MAG TPA: ComEC/Rec2 family competence protein [Candidatus Paceibacterota bacterium]
MMILYHNDMNRRLKIRLALFTLLLFVCVISVYIYVTEIRSKILTVAFLNIGQGDAIFIEAPNGNQVLIDGGPGRSILREIGAMMPFYDRSIDVVIATHPDADHVGGLNDVFDRYKISLFMEPGVDTDTNVYLELKRKIASTTLIEARRGMVVELGAGVNLEIIFPVGDVTNWETNDASIVARLVYGETEFLLTGDAPIKTENALIYLGSNLNADILKVGHHGSKTSTSDLFVKAVAPEYAVISSGKENRYGHPTLEVLKILENNNVKILRTDTEGRIVFGSDGANLKLK